MLGVSRKMLTLAKQDFTKLTDVQPELASFHPEFIGAIASAVQKLMKKEKMHFETGGTPTFSSYLNEDSSHVFFFNEPRMEIRCTKNNHRFIVREVLHEFNYID